tara:strand:- start:1029 stop:2030 length:1002 start_codon:yes stop_codon:yes gene_type:complete
MESKIEKIWADIEVDSNQHSGLIYKRYSALVKPDVFVAIKAPESLRNLAIRLVKPIGIRLDDFNLIRDIKLESYPDERDNEKEFLLIVLLNNDFKDIFSTFCEDLIFSVENCMKQEEVIEGLVDRISKWRTLLEKIGKKGMSPEAQRGLYGELYFLRKYIENTKLPIECIQTWKGPENSIQDFQNLNWAIEVKTTHGKNHQKIQIANERQLDNSVIDNIILYHLSLDIRNGNGETLNQIILTIMRLLKGHSTAGNLFKMKLMQANYFTEESHLYLDMGYSIRQENIYGVNDSFPKITENDIPKGVGDVHYSIVLTESESWRIQIEDMFNIIFT